MPLIDITCSMVLVIDAQQNFYPVDRRDVDRLALDTMFRRAAWLVAVAGRLKIPVVVTEEDAAVHGATSPVIRDAMPKGTPVLPKWTFGAADNPEILAAIEGTGASTTILLGLETDVCVAHSALGLKERGKRVVVVHDVLYSPGSAHANGLGRMERAGIETVSAKELVYDWLRTVQGARDFFRMNPDLEDPPGFSL
ncbi:MAG: isochorismatase family protein [Clostridia bacterium]